jgi:thiosulfate/3-mercaptopyruvate sulfurtransferase
MHGAGVVPAIDRYGITGRIQCATCHDSVQGSNPFHTAGHVSAMSCQLCHSQPYKNCYSCHTQEDAATGLGYFANNVTDPTREARKAQPTDSLPPGDALMTFRAGKNPKFGIVPGAKAYSVLRHVPVDADVFTYTEEGTQLPGLIPELDALPTWKYATPHNIARQTAITTDPDGTGPQTACGNCHSPRYSRFWLTDPMQDAHGWAGGNTFEVGANAGVVQPAPIAPVLVE